MKKVAAAICASASIVAATASLAYGDGLPGPLPVPVPLPVPTVTVPAATVPTVPVPAVTLPVPNVSVPPATAQSSPTPPPAKAQSAEPRSTSPTSSPATSPAPAQPAGAPTPTNARAHSDAAPSTGTSGRASSSPASNARGGATTGQVRVTAAASTAHTTRSYASRHAPASITFRLPSRVSLSVTIMQVYPRCSVATSFRLAGRAGVNHLRVARTVNGHALAVGTYRVDARAGGRALFHFRIVVLHDVTPTQAELLAARARNACRRGVPLAGMPLVLKATRTRGHATRKGATAAVAASIHTSQARSPHPKTRRAAGSGAVGQSASATDRPIVHVLGAQATPVRGEVATNPLLAGFLFLAIVLLGTATLPTRALAGSDLGLFLARRRSAIAFAGGWALLAFFVAYVLIVA